MSDLDKALVGYIVGVLVVVFGVMIALTIAINGQRTAECERRADGLPAQNSSVVCE